MNKPLVITLSAGITAVLALSGTACANAQQPTPSVESATETPSSPATPSTTSTPSTPATPGRAGLANPWMECNTLKKAAMFAGFDAPALPDGYTITGVRVIKGEMMELDLVSGRSSLTLRKAKGANQDVSGDYNNYDTMESTTSEGIEMELRREEYGPIRVGTWSIGDYSYALLTDEISEEGAANIANATLGSDNNAQVVPETPETPATPE